MHFDHCSQHEDDHEMMMHWLQCRYQYRFYNHDHDGADDEHDHSSGLNLDCQVETQKKDWDRMILNDHML